MHTYNHWITDIEKPTTATAFTYTIWFPILGLRYIGYKTVSDKSNWITYTSSSKPTNKLIRAGHKAIYRIIKWFDNAEDAHKEEIAAMTSYDVTKRSEYLNQCISGVKFGGPISAEQRAKMSASHKGKTLSDEHRAKLSAAKKGRPKSDEHRAKMSAAKKGRVFSDETKAKMSEAKQIGLYVTPLGAFNTLKEASISHNCVDATIYNRCKSTRTKFNDWSFIPNKDR